jgi:hypothetical protein
MNTAYKYRPCYLPSPKRKLIPEPRNFSRDMRFSFREPRRSNGSVSSLALRKAQPPSCLGIIRSILYAYCRHDDSVAGTSELCNHWHKTPRWGFTGGKRSQSNSCPFILIVLASWQLKPKTSAPSSKTFSVPNRTESC